MNTKDINKIDNFIELFKNFKQKQQQQKLRGLNDFNLFTTLLKASDEVRLHSRFLNFLLNPNGEHCQGSLFLDLFLEKCGLADFLDTSNTSVFAEYNSIDLYLTDGNNHIIIENKIWAGDQQKQIKRYIETIKEENKDINLTENLVVIYLSLDREEPTDYSLYNSITEKQNFYKLLLNFLILCRKWFFGCHRLGINQWSCILQIQKYCLYLKNLLARIFLKINPKTNFLGNALRWGSVKNSKTVNATEPRRLLSARW